MEPLKNVSSKTITVLDTLKIWLMQENIVSILSDCSVSEVIY